MTSINLPLKANRYIMTPVVLYDRFSKEECERIIQEVKTQDNGYKLDENNDPNYGVRIREREESAWLLKKIIEIFVEANAEYYHFDINEMSELALLRYQKDAVNEWHTDNSDINQYLDNKKKSQDLRTRKISLSILLSDPKDFEGGELEFNPPFKYESKQGNVVVFPAYLMHQITPITKGTRFSVIASAKGPPYR